jgi:ribosomal-protein-alanine N-acetyltransferase
MIILPMERRHVETIAALERICFTEPWPAESFISELCNPLAVYFVAERDNAVLGYAGMHVILDEGHITNVAVSPEYRRHGVGRALCEALFHIAAQRALRLLTLEVRAGNYAAQDMYRKLGFVEVGRRAGYYTAPREDALLMTKDLVGDNHEHFSL